MGADTFGVWLLAFAAGGWFCRFWDVEMRFRCVVVG